jgi:hypothetical protein
MHVSPNEISADEFQDYLAKYDGCIEAISTAKGGTLIMRISDSQMC